MSTLTSSSTDAEVNAAYDDNASYAEDSSATKAAAFITACRFLLRRMAKTAGHGPATLTLSPELVLQEMRAAQAWLAANPTDTNAGVIHYSFNEMRT